MSAYSLGPLLHEGKAKRVYATDQTDLLAVEFKDDATAFNAQKRAQLSGKGVLNCQISALLFEYLELQGIPTHFMGLPANATATAHATSTASSAVGEAGGEASGEASGEAGGNWMLVRPVRVVPLEVVIRNIAAGSLCKQLPIAPGTRLEQPLLDFYYKDDGLGDPLLSEARLRLLGLVDDAQRIAIEQLAWRVNTALGQLFAGLDLELVDFKIELGYSVDGQLLLADEISPDNCRLWDRGIADSQARILDKDRFRQDLGGVVEAYGEVLKRVQGVCPEPRVYR
jgi:phosphoribosylaminoimidazole-succinocarboxamide synthase